MANEDLISVDYEIFGRVQGVFFRKYTQLSTGSHDLADGVISSLSQKGRSLVWWDGSKTQAQELFRGSYKAHAARGYLQTNKNPADMLLSKQAMVSVTAVFIGLPKDVTEGV